MTINDVSIAASIASVVLACVAIYLAFKFYELSEDGARRAAEASRQIGESVNRLEALFDKLYSGTFTMLDETMDDLRRFAWPEPVTGTEPTREEVSEEIDHRFEKLRGELASEVSNILSRQSLADEKLDGTVAAVADLIDRAIAGSRDVHDLERSHQLRQEVENAIMLRARYHAGWWRVTVSSVRELVAVPHETDEFVGVLNDMRNEGLLTFSGAVEDPSTRIYVVDRRLDAMSEIQAPPSRMQ